MFLKSKVQKVKSLNAVDRRPFVISFVQPSCNVWSKKSYAINKNLEPNWLTWWFNPSNSASSPLPPLLMNASNTSWKCTFVTWAFAMARFRIHRPCSITIDSGSPFSIVYVTNWAKRLTLVLWCDICWQVAWKSWANPWSKTILNSANLCLSEYAECQNMLSFSPPSSLQDAVKGVSFWKCTIA